LPAYIVDIRRLSFEENIVQERLLAGLDRANQDVSRATIFIMGDFMLAHKLK
jgi:hypothetical protein